MPFEAHDGSDVQEQQTVMLHIPDTMKSWRALGWTRTVNPLYEEIGAESIAWACQFGHFTDRGWDYTDILVKMDVGTENSVYIYADG